jgi:hypothetical protein
MYSRKFAGFRCMKFIAVVLFANITVIQVQMIVSSVLFRICVSGRLPLSGSTFS